MSDTQTVQLINLVRQLCEIEHAMEHEAKNMTEVGMSMFTSRAIETGASIASLGMEIERTSWLGRGVLDMPVGMGLMRREEEIWDYSSIPDRLVYDIPAAGEGKSPVFDEGADPWQAMKLEQKP